MSTSGAFGSVSSVISQLRSLHLLRERCDPLQRFYAVLDGFSLQSLDCYCGVLPRTSMEICPESSFTLSCPGQSYPVFIARWILHRLSAN